MATVASEATWVPLQGLSEAGLRALIAGEIPAIRMPGFASAAECRRFCDAIRSGAVAGKAATTSQMSLIGCNFSNHAGRAKEDYFALVEPSYRDVGRLADAAGFDPLARMIERLQAVWPGHVGVAVEPGYGRYFAGGVKTRTSSGHLHYDFVPHTAPGFAIAQITDQLGLNLYLDMPGATGETITYRRPVRREGGPLGRGPGRAMNLEAAYVEGAPSFTFRPEIGEVVIISTRNPHDIIVGEVAAGEWRVQTSAFVGRLPDDDLVLWS